MIKFIGLFVVLLLALGVGGVVVLSSSNPQPTSAKIEKVVPDAKFAR